MTKKTSAKPEKSPAKKLEKSPAKKPGKRADTSPAEKPAEKKGKTKRAADEAREGAAERVAPPWQQPAPAAPEAPPAPAAPMPAPASTASVLDDSPERWIDAKAVHEKVKFLLKVCPKPKEQPALAFVLLRGNVGLATDERSHYWVDFGVPVSETSLKVTRASIDSFLSLLDGELKAAEKLDASAVVRWDGLVATIRREGEPDGRVVTLDKFESGPAPEALVLDAPEFAEGSHATLSVERLRNAVDWKGEATANVFVSPAARQVWILLDVGGFTFARAAVAFEGSLLGIRQPWLPMDVSGRPAPAASQPAPEPQVIEPEVVLPAGAPRGLPAGLAWVRVECDRGAAWERLTRQATELLAPFSVEPGPGGEGGLVVWGPYPREAARARFVFAYLKSQGADPRVVPCEAINLWTRALAQAASAPPLGLADGAVAGALPAGGGDGDPAFPAPDTDVCAILGDETWSSLTDAERAALEAIVAWDHNTSDRDRGSHDMAPDVAMRLAAAMEAMGLRAAVERVDEEDGSITFWRVRRDDRPRRERPAAGPAFPSLRDDGRAELHIDRAAWRSMPGAVAAEVVGFPWVQVSEEGDLVTLAAMGPVEVAAVAELLASAGLRCARVVVGEDRETWVVTGPAPARQGLAAFPEPAGRPVVVEIPEALWDELTPDQLAELHTPTKLSVSWFTGPTSTSSSMTAAAEARAVGALLAGWGYRCERAEDATRYGYEVTVWHVGRAGERRGEAV